MNTDLFITIGKFLNKENDKQYVKTYKQILNERKLYKPYDLVNIQFNNNILNNLKWLQNINIWQCDIEDVSMLSTVHTLSLWDCPKVEDLSMLGTVHTLSLCDCPKVEDVSMLGTVHTLNIHNCLNVKDVSMLGTVHKLLFMSLSKSRRCKYVGYSTYT
jgi:hypothetical protein